MKQQETATGDGDKARQQGNPDRATGADEQGHADHERAGQPQQPARRRADHHRRDQGRRGGRRGRSDEAAAQTSQQGAARVNAPAEADYLRAV